MSASLASAGGRRGERPASQPGWQLCIVICFILIAWSSVRNGWCQSTAARHRVEPAIWRNPCFRAPSARQVRRHRSACTSRHRMSKRRWFCALLLVFADVGCALCLPQSPSLAGLSRVARHGFLLRTPVSRLVRPQAQPPCAPSPAPPRTAPQPAPCFVDPWLHCWVAATPQAAAPAPSPPAPLVVRSCITLACMAPTGAPLDPQALAHTAYTRLAASLQPAWMEVSVQPTTNHGGYTRWQVSAHFTAHSESGYQAWKTNLMHRLGGLMLSDPGTPPLLARARHVELLALLPHTDALTGLPTMVVWPPDVLFALLPQHIPGMTLHWVGFLADQCLIRLRTTATGLLDSLALPAPLRVPLHTPLFLCSLPAARRVLQSPLHLPVNDTTVTYHVRRAHFSATGHPLDATAALAQHRGGC
jgi:hypothetical protein